MLRAVVTRVRWCGGLMPFVAVWATVHAVWVGAILVVRAPRPAGAA